MEQQKELKIEISPEVAVGKYCNLAVISHSPQEMFLDFVTVAPNMPQASVQSRIVMTPENAKNLLFALRDNIAKYEQIFGEIQHKMAKSVKTTDGLPNPFQA